MATTMKTMTTPHFTSLACFLLLSCAAAQGPGAVLDSSGNEVQTGVEYYISSIFWGALGGDLSLRDEGTCPLPVIQMPSDIIPRIPVTFHRASGGGGRTVRVRDNVDVKFASALCNGSTVWTVGLDAWTRSITVRTWGELGSERDPDYWFQIHPKGSNYNLAYCYACERCRMAAQCWDLSIIRDIGGRRRLALTLTERQPFEVRFVRAEAGDASGKIKMRTGNLMIG